MPDFPALPAAVKKNKGLKGSRGRVIQQMCQSLAVLK
jgi:hypothetical protein